MRITNNMLSTNLLRNIQSAQGKLDDLQNQLSSFHRVNKPSDDPAGVENILKLNNSISSVNQWKKNADQAVSYMSTTDSTLGDISSMLNRVKELAVQGASDTSSPESRKAIAVEVDQISQELQNMANTKVGNKYIFGGTQTNQKPLVSVDALGNPTWAGNGNDIAFNVGDGINLPISVKGTKLFVNPGTTNSDGSITQGLFKTLSNLRTALNGTVIPPSTTVGESVGTTLEDIDGNLDNIIAQRADLGARVNRITTLGDQLDTMTTNLQKNVSGIQDADMAQTILEFQSQQNVYQAALSIGAKIIQPSLVDFMR